MSRCFLLPPFIFSPLAIGLSSSAYTCHLLPVHYRTSELSHTCHSFSPCHFVTQTCHSFLCPQLGYSVVQLPTIHFSTHRSHPHNPVILLSAIISFIPQHTCHSVLYAPLHHLTLHVPVISSQMHHITHSSVHIPFIPLCTHYTSITRSTLHL